MKIKGLEITGFGVWSALALEHVPGGLSVFYGPNEAGKTTVMEFIRSVLFGFAAERRRYLPPVHGGRAGGMLRVSHGGQTYEIARHGGGPNDPEETLQITGADGVRQGEHLLKQLLYDFEEGLFSGVFCIGLKELQRLGVLDDTQAASMLYDLSIGGPGVSMVEVIQSLAASRNHLISRDDGPDLLKQLLEERAAILEQIEDLPRQLHTYERCLKRQKELHDAVAKERETLRHGEHDARILQLAINVDDAWRRRETITAQIEELGEVAPVPPQAIQDLERLNHEFKQVEEHLEAVRVRWDELQGRLSELRVDHKLLEYGPTIRGLLARREWLEQTRQTVETLRGRIHDLEAQLAAAPRFGDAPGSLPSYHLREMAQQMQRDMQALTKARQEVEMCQKTAESLHDRLQIELTKYHETDLLDAKQRAGERRKRLEERIQIDRERDQLRGREEELDQTCAKMRENPGLSLTVINLLWLMMVGGFVLLGMMYWWGWLAGVPGAVLAILPPFLRYYLDDRQRKKLEANEKDLAMIREQIVVKDQRVESLDSVLPASEKALPEQLDDAARRCRALDELDRVHYDCESAKKDLDDARMAVREHEAELAKTEGAWKGALREAGLSDRLSPHEIDEVIQHHSQREDVQRELQRAREDFGLRERELEMTVAEIRHVVAENQIETPENDPPAQLARLAERLEEEEANRRARIELAQARRKLRKDWKKAKQDRVLLKKRRARVLRKAQARDERDLQDRVARYEMLQQCTHDRDAAQREISTAIGGACTEDEIGALLASDEAAMLSRRLEEAEETLENLREQIDRLLEDKGRCDERVQSLREARDEATTMLELGMVEQRIRDLIEHWRVRAVACRMLEDIRNVYETKRQPETLHKASEYLAVLTQGRWVRVWTPMGENGLLVDGSEGRSRRLELLSHGTREQLFLALRLALAESFADRGIHLPMILDDVLVNFDSRRARAAAELLCRFGESGRQVLLFTCHRHIAELFRSVRAPVRRFPQRSEGRGRLDFADGAGPTERQPAQPRPARLPKAAPAGPSDTVAENVSPRPGHGAPQTAVANAPETTESQQDANTVRPHREAGNRPETATPSGSSYLGADPPRDPRLESREQKPPEAPDLQPEKTPVEQEMIEPMPSEPGDATGDRYAAQEPPKDDQLKEISSEEVLPEEELPEEELPEEELPEEIPSMSGSKVEAPVVEASAFNKPPWADPVIEAQSPEDCANDARGGETGTESSVEEDDAPEPPLAAEPIEAAPVAGDTRGASAWIDDPMEEAVDEDEREEDESSASQAASKPDVADLIHEDFWYDRADDDWDDRYEDEYDSRPRMEPRDAATRAVFEGNTPQAGGDIYRIVDGGTDEKPQEEDDAETDGDDDDSWFHRVGG